MQELAQWIMEDEMVFAAATAAVAWFVVWLLKFKWPALTEGAKVAQCATACGIALTTALLTQIAAAEPITLVALIKAGVAGWIGAMGIHALGKRVTQNVLVNAAILPLALVALVALSVVGIAHSEPGGWEARTYTTVAPKPVEDWGIGVAYELGTLPAGWAIIGERIVFLDAIQLEERTVLGASMSVRRAPLDDGWRGWAAVWLEGNKPLGAAGFSRVMATW